MSMAGNRIKYFRLRFRFGRNRQGSLAADDIDRLLERLLACRDGGQRRHPVAGKYEAVAIAVMDRERFNGASMFALNAGSMIRGRLRGRCDGDDRKKQAQPPNPTEFGGK